jgi:hypothetical protein
MNKPYFKKFLYLGALFFLFSCERDDICIETITESPDLVLLMLDKDNTEQTRTPAGFSIRALGTEKGFSNAALRLLCTSPENTREFYSIRIHTQPRVAKMKTSIRCRLITNVLTNLSMRLAAIVRIIF